MQQADCNIAFRALQNVKTITNILTVLKTEIRNIHQQRSKEELAGGEEEGVNIKQLIQIK